MTFWRMFLKPVLVGSVILVLIACLALAVGWAVYPGDAIEAQFSFGVLALAVVVFAVLLTWLVGAWVSLVRDGEP